MKNENLTLRVRSEAEKMTPSTPIYTTAADTYHADTCHALVEAAEKGQVHLHALVHCHYPGRTMATNLLPGVKTVGFWDCSRDQTWGLDWHRNEGIELALLDSGTMAFATDEQSSLLKPGDLTITRPWQRHRVGDPYIGAGRLIWLIVDVDVRRPHQSWTWPPWLVLTRSDLVELTNMLRHNEQPVWHATPDVWKCFQKISRAVESDQDGSNGSLLTIHINELLLLVLEMLRQQRIPLDVTLSETTRTVELFLTDLSENIQHLAQEWTVHRMAQACGLGVTQFVHYCRQQTNLSPLQFLNYYRLETAKNFLTTKPELSIVDVAHRCGYSSAQYFATVFRKQQGCSPREYRIQGGAKS